MALASFLALVWIGAGSSQGWWTPPAASAVPSLGDGLVSGIFVAGAGCAAMVGWRRHARSAAGWVVATGVLVAGQSLLVTLIALQSTPPRSSAVQWLVLAVVAAGAAAVVGPLATTRRAGSVVDDTLVIGVGMGLVAAGHLLLQFPRTQPPTPLITVVCGALVATHAVVTVLVLRQRSVDRRLAVLLAATTVVVGLGQLVPPLGLSGTAADSLLWLARTGLGAAWLAAGWCVLRRAMEDERRRIDSVERVLVDATRDQRERLHELRSAVAGLVSGSQLLDREDLSAEMRIRLWTSLRRELDRMERMLSGEVAAATDLRLDEALEVILDVQRLKGRQVELRSSGDVVRARFDALAEVVNVLMDNAVKHGGTDSSVVEVVRRDEETVDITITDFGRGIPKEKRAQIFEWGGRASAAPGEGIGLHVAKRLMTEDGGSLALAEREGTGSSFVISLPAARRSPENDLTMEGSHGWRRSG
ncbi:signal transduction histidine kinase [Nocardioides cavernae]|uniref:Sensor-like histidine kinase SenX3 n=1 Tax=Nocardioides cavernae TaxID=1921566 RepID=A0A7Y9H0H0_9ACTN|nr:HAMP domain-containing sensor histidine kinase [Nocardioides cavernae]NYE35508.1 signal transduction histidine kinase [Nocardioides cavernae]